MPAAPGTLFVHNDKPTVFGNGLIRPAVLPHLYWNLRPALTQGVGLTDSAFITVNVLIRLYTGRSLSQQRKSAASKPIALPCAEWNLVSGFTVNSCEFV